MSLEAESGQEGLTRKFTLHWYGSVPAVALFANEMVERRADIITGIPFSRDLGMLLYDMHHFGRWNRRLPVQRDFSLPVFDTSSEDRKVSITTSLSIFLQELEQMVVAEIESGGRPADPTFSGRMLRSVAALSELAKTTTDARLTLVCHQKSLGLTIEEMHVPDYGINIVNPEFHHEFPH